MARISEKVIDTLKQTIDLVAVIKDRGVTLRALRQADQTGLPAPHRGGINRLKPVRCRAQA